MKWLYNILWLTAWGVWLWLGVGLYRELPRDLGPVVCKLPLTPTEKFVDFLHGAPSVITKNYDSLHARAVFRRRSAVTGEIEFELTPDGRDSDRWTFTVSARHGFVIGCEESLAVGSFPQAREIRLREKLSGEVRLFDLHDGRRRIFNDLGTLSRVNETRPWALFFRNVGADERLVVLDLKSGHRILETKTHGGGFAYGWLPSFVGADHFTIYIPTAKGDAFSYELYSIASGRLVRTFPESASWKLITPDQKIAWYDHPAGSPYTLNVEDLATGTSSFTHTSGNRVDHVAPLHLSRDGRRILSPGTEALIDLDSGIPLWTAAKHELASWAIPPDYFEVEELWSLMGEHYSVKTYAIRSMTDGSFAYRSWRSFHGSANEDHTLMHTDGAIRRLPLNVHWPLLVFCQVILMSPLLFVWALLRWRRRQVGNVSTSAANQIP